MRIKPLAVLAAVAALGVPATAVAAKPATAGPKATTEHAAKGKAHAKKPKNAVFTGTVVSVDGTTVTVHVDKANHWGRAYKGTDVAFDVSGVKHAPVVVAGDAVQVQAKIASDAVPPFAARKLHKRSTDDAADDAPAPPAAP